MPEKPPTKLQHRPDGALVTEGLARQGLELFKRTDMAAPIPQALVAPQREVRRVNQLDLPSDEVCFALEGEVIAEFVRLGEISPAAFKHAWKHIRMDEVRRLYIHRDGFFNVSGGNTLEFISGLTQLKWLFLNRTQVTDEGLRHLSGLTQLKWLLLYQTKVTDEGLRHLSGLTQLTELGLYFTPEVTNKGLRHLSGLTQLTTLHLVGNKVTDEGLRHLSGLTQLTELKLSHTKVTDEGIKHLRRLMPQTSISR